MDICPGTSIQLELDNAHIVDEGEPYETYEQCNDMLADLEALVMQARDSALSTSFDEDEVRRQYRWTRYLHRRLARFSRDERKISPLLCIDLAHLLFEIVSIKIILRFRTRSFIGAMELGNKMFYWIQGGGPRSRYACTLHDHELEEDDGQFFLGMKIRSIGFALCARRSILLHE